MSQINTPFSVGTMSRWVGALILAVSIALMGCSSPAEKAESFYQKGEALLKKGNDVQARLQFNNALQIKNNMTKAWIGLAKVAEHEGNWTALYGLLNKILELDPKNLDARLKLGRLMLGSGHLDKALEASNYAMSLNKNDPEALTLHAAIMLKLGNKKQAVSEANEVLAKHPNNIEAFAVLASERMESKDPAKAVEYIDRALQLNQKNISLLRMKITALEEMSDFATEEKVYKQLIADYPTVRRFRDDLALFYLRHNRQPDAEAELRSIVKAFPKDLQAKLDIVRFANQVKGPQAARKELNALLQNDPNNVELKFTLASFDLAQKDIQPAMAIYRGIIKDSTVSTQNVIKAKGLLAATLLKSGDKKGATDLINEVLGQDSRNEEALLLKASMEIDSHNLDQAIADLRTVLRDVPNSARAMLLLGKAYAMNGSPDLADQSYLNGYQASHGAPAFGLAYADYLLKQNHAERAEKVLEDVLSVTPKSVEALKLLAQARISLNDWPGAQKVADELRAIGGQNNTSDQIMGIIYANRKEYGESISSFKRAAQESPSDIQPVLNLVRTYILAGKLDNAISFVDAALKTNPDNNEIRLLQGKLYAMKGDEAQAVQSFKTVIAKSPDHNAPYVALAALYLRNQQYPDASHIISQGLQAIPGNPVLKMMQAVTDQNSGKIDDSIRIYRSLLKEHPNLDVAANNLASLLTDYGQDKASFNEAVELSKRFKNSDIPEYRDTYAWSEYKAGHLDTALKEMIDVTKVKPKQPTFHYHLGMIYLAKQNKAMARKELNKALDLAGNHPFAKADEIKKTLKNL